jgi:drug/metabolite transporter (DMT)-like permease
MAWGCNWRRRLGHDAQSFLFEQRPSLVNTPPPSRPFAYLCLALSMSLVGSYVALSKPLAAVLPVLLLAWMRFGIGGIAMLHWLKKPANEPPLTPQTKRLLFLESFLGNFLFTICMIYGVSLTDAVSAGVTMAAIPAAVALMGWAFLGERVAPRTWMAVLCAVVGIALFSLSKPEHSAHMEPALGAKNTANHAWWGQMLLLGAVVCEAAYTVIGKKLTGSLGPKRITSLINLWGFVLTTPFGLYLALDFPFASVGWGTWVLLLFYALAACMWTVWLWMTGLKAVPAAQGGVFSVMLPVSAALVGVLFLGEALTDMQLVAFAIALASVLLATLPSRAPLRVGRGDRPDRS